MKKKIVILSTFNTAKGLEERGTHKWIENRLDIFYQFTLKSIKAQTNQNFEMYLKSMGESLPIIHHYVQERGGLPSNVHFDVWSRCKEAIITGLEAYDKLYLVRLDSDDMYRNDWIQRLYDFSPKSETEVLISQNGYIYDSHDGTLATYYRKSPPFYVNLYDAKDYIEGTIRVNQGGHRNIIKNYCYEVIEGHNFMVTLHGRNTSSNRNLIEEDRIIEVETEKKKIMRAFGL